MAQIELADVERAVPGGFEERGNARFVRPQVRARRHAPDAGEQVIAPGEERRTRRRAGGGDDEVAEQGRLAREAIEVGRAHEAVAVEAEIAEALVVADDQEDVGLLAGLHGDERRRGQPQEHKWQEEGNTGHGGGLQRAEEPTATIRDKIRRGRMGSRTTG
ncbi:MAG: hypothetical protein QM813_06110 [Verrucomicrobiota bacterium]